MKIGHISKNTQRTSQKKQSNVEKNIFCVSQHTCTRNPRRQRSTDKISENFQVKLKGAEAAQTASHYRLKNAV